MEKIYTECHSILCICIINESNTTFLNVARPLQKKKKKKKKNEKKSVVE